MRVYVPCCPDKLPAWTWAYVYDFCCWRYVNLFHIDRHCSPSEQLSPPGAAPAGASGSGLAQSGAAGAAIIVKLCPNARLIVDDEVSKVTTPMQKLDIASLEPGIRYPYVLQCEFDSQGKRRIITRDVLVEAGQTVHVDFNEEPTVAAKKPVDTATIVVKVPENAKLSVNGETTAARMGTHAFVVTGLNNGKTFDCDLSCDVEREGTVFSVRRRVAVEPGGVVRVDFANLAESIATR